MRTRHGRRRAPVAAGRTTTPVTAAPLSVDENPVTGDSVYGAGTTRYGDSAWPGLTGRPLIHLMDQDNGVNIAPYAAANVVDTDVTIGGAPGMTNRTPWAAGVVETSTMEQFEMTGRVIRVYRPSEGIYGVVAGGTDYNAQYLSAYAHSGYRETPDSSLYPDLGGAI